MIVLKAPLQELALRVQFDAEADLSVLQAASIYEVVESRYPIFQQNELLPPITAMPVAAAPVVSIERGLPRLWFASLDQSLLLQYQTDLLALNWRRQGAVAEPTEYLGFDALHALFWNELDGLKDFYSPDAKPAVGEIHYRNFVPMEYNGRQRRLSEILAFFAPTRKNGIMNFAFAWGEPLELGLEVDHRPNNDNWYHGGIQGDMKKNSVRKGIAKRLKIVVPIDEVLCEYFHSEPPSYDVIS
jgi:uncharacterized protein (TIGR04255 family)